MHILVVEDDRSIVEGLTALLEREGYLVSATGRQDAAVELLQQQGFDLLLLDVALEQGNGFAVCAAAKKNSADTPVIFLTASDDEYSTVAGLDMGAVDYIAKPFRPRELLSRVRVALRNGAHTERAITVGDVTLNPTSAMVTKAGKEVFLSALEYRLLLFMFREKGHLITREALRDAIWDSAGEYVSDNAINVYIRRLREKIETDPADPYIILTVRGLGYKVGD